MLYLKKYFTEGLIQFTILLSLIGVRVDVDTYLTSQLPPLREIILGPSSAYTQTQFHNLRNTLDGYGIHPKVPSTELSAWLVHRDPDSVGTAGQSSPSIALDNGSGLDDMDSNPEGSVMRGEGSPGSSYGGGGEGGGGGGAAVAETLAPSLPRCWQDIALIDILWRQDMDLGAGRDVFDYSNRHKDSEPEKRPSGEKEEGEGWQNRQNLQGGGRHSQVDGETGESIPVQLADLGDQTTLSLQECLRLLEATFPFGDEAEFPGPVSPELGDPSEEGPSTSQGPLLSPLLPQNDTTLDLEQQWQDIMAIMELQPLTKPHSSTCGNEIGLPSGKSPEVLAELKFGRPREEFIAVRVQDPRVQSEGSWNSYVDFKIFLHTNSKAFTAKTSCVRRRYSEFVWLRKQLQKNAGLVPVPELPVKTPFFSLANEDFIERRRQGLQQFLDKLLHMTVFLSDSQLHMFLQTQLRPAHIEQCVQGHTPYSVTDAILSYASSNRGWAQEEEGGTAEASLVPVPYESADRYGSPVYPTSCHSGLTGNE
ncbi:NF2L1 protein, partial [Amia calva]|nr:NF2L1 protein [Amia calva]